VESKEWIIDTDCDFYNNFVELYSDKGVDVSDKKQTFLGHQWDVIGSSSIDWKKLKDWVLEKIDPYVQDIEILKSWCIEYNDGGYQALHNHGIGHLSMVVSLDDQPHEGKTGTLYTLCPDKENKMVYKEFKPHKGRTVIMTGGVWHGVYPSKNPRRTFVADYKIKGIKNGI
tara:strand:+ start:1442 stop:1954 length:513 start_codon:yes stop_codon:yes gene_type:complete